MTCTGIHPDCYTGGPRCPCAHPRFEPLVPVAIKPRGHAVVPSAEQTFRVDQAKLALQTAIADGTAMVVSRDGGFMVDTAETHDAMDAAAKAAEERRQELHRLETEALMYARED